jgi:hypothetical protein
VPESSITGIPQQPPPMLIALAQAFGSPKRGCPTRDSSLVFFPVASVSFIV